MNTALEALLAPYRAAVQGDEITFKNDPLYSLLTPPPTTTQKEKMDATAAGLGVSAGSYQDYARKLARRMFGPGDWDELSQLVSHESGWNPDADNPTSSAHGLFQFLDSTRANYGLGLNARPRRQIQAGLQYIADRYGDPDNAWDFWQSHNWY